MVRTQIQLTEEQAQRVKALAAARHVSMATIIRESVDHYVGDVAVSKAGDRRARALRLIGAFASTQSDLSSRHDAYVAEAYE